MATHGPERGEVKAPVWVVVMTYSLCWGAAAFLVYTDEPGDWQRLVAAFLFTVWPMSGTSPLELLRAWRGK
jgi:hypothetical protein